MVEIDGKEYELNTDYRAALYTILAFEDDELTQSEKACKMLDNLYFEMPDNLELALEKAQWFLNSGKKPLEDDNPQRLYSFEQDAELIFSAFQQTHGINLNNTNLHWWRFFSLFMDLGKNTFFCSLTGLRSRYYAGKCTKEEKEEIHKMGDTFYVSQNTNLTFEEKELSAKIKERYLKAKARRKQKAK